MSLVKRTPEQMRLAALTKAARAAIRTKHSIAADYELNDFLPDAVERYESAQNEGRLLELEVSLGDFIGDRADDEASR
jgi:hypothetical protein